MIGALLFIVILVALVGACVYLTRGDKHLRGNGIDAGWRYGTNWRRDGEEMQRRLPKWTKKRRWR